MTKLGEQLTVVAFGAFVGTSLTIGVDILLGHAVVAIPTALAVAGVCGLLAACFHLVSEARAALRGNREEILFYQALHRRRSATDCGDTELDPN